MDWTQLNYRCIANQENEVRYPDCSNKTFSKRLNTWEELGRIGPTDQIHRDGQSGMTTIKNVKTKPVDKNTWKDFETLFKSKGAPKYCWCMAWRMTKEELKHNNSPGRKRIYQTACFVRDAHWIVSLYRKGAHRLVFYCAARDLPTAGR